MTNYACYLLSGQFFLLTKKNLQLMETTSVDFHRVIPPSFLGQYSWLPTA